jgi:hypothetical protein
VIPLELSPNRRIVAKFPTRQLLTATAFLIPGAVIGDRRRFLHEQLNESLSCLMCTLMSGGRSKFRALDKGREALDACVARIKWRHWPESAATWARIRHSRRAEMMEAYRNSAAAA